MELLRRFFKKYWSDLGAILILTLLIFAFFSRLFSPQPSIFAIPDHGLSDIWHFNYPLKELLSRSLKSNHLPLWTNLLGDGFPLLAQGEIGTFNLFNLFFYKFFPTWLAFNFTYLASFWLIIIGTYLYARYIHLNLLSSIFAASVFTFSGFFTAQVNHLSHIQTASYLPLLFLATEMLLRKASIRRGLLFSLILSQQIASGHYQYVFISLVALITYTTFRIVWRRKRISVIFLLSAMMLLGFLLSAIQLLPSIEFFRVSSRARGLTQQQINLFQYSLKHLSLLVSPFSLGNPKTGTYDFKQLGNYWETVAFVGIIPLILAVSSIFFLTCKNSLKKPIFSYWGLLLFSLLLVFGDKSPLYFIFSLPPFSYFRVPSRFLIVFLWSLAILSGITLQYLKRPLLRTFISVFLTIIAFFQLINFAREYHVFTPVRNILRLPETGSYLKNQKEGRIISLFGGFVWNKYFLEKGWQDIKPYLFFRNSLNSNLSAIFNFPHANIYTGIPLRRQFFYKYLIMQNLAVKTKEIKTIKVNNSSLKLLGMASVKKIISPFTLENKNLRNVYETKENLDGFPSYKIYENKTVLPRTRMVYKYQKVDTVEELQRTLLSPDFKPEKEVILEKEVFHENTNPHNNDSESDLSNSNYFSKIAWLKDEDQEIELEVKTEKDGFLVLADTYYPGWKAYVDGEETEILAANLNQRAIRVGEGSHKIRFSYQPKSFQIGAALSLTTHLFIFTLLTWSLLKKAAKKLLTKIQKYDIL